MSFCPNAITFTCILKACGTCRAIDKGKEIHDEIVSRRFLESDVVLGNALVDMYCKCGMLTKAQQVLEELPMRNASSWSALIIGYTQHGQGHKALNCFELMQSQGFSPNSITLLCVLNACCHAGLVDEGQMYFANMIEKYGVLPEVEHYTTMVDLYGRAGHLDKAMDMITNMSSADHTPAWSALLTACRKWENVKLGRLAFEQAIVIDNENTSTYLTMINIYTAAGMHEDAEKIEAMRKLAMVKHELKVHHSY